VPGTPEDYTGSVVDRAVRLDSSCGPSKPSLALGCLLLEFMSMKKRMKISKGGQVSIPAAIRHRWETSTVVLEDLGDRITLEPAPDDPIAAAEGALAGDFPELEVNKLRRRAREDERSAESRRRR
jgi:hypothetical protein